MPGNIQQAAPSGVLPQSLCKAFTESRVFPSIAAAYHDGTIERSLVVDGANNPVSIRTFRLTQRLAAADLATLRTFFEAHYGTPFFFYNPFEPSGGSQVGSNYDSLGSSTQGRYTCIFMNQQWAETVTLGRSETSIELMVVS